MLPHTVICMGRSGSGKGTQIKLLQELIKKQHSDASMIHIETGEYFRAFIQENSVSAHISKKVYLEGQRQPDFLAISMWGYVLCKDYTGDEHLVFDGTPRSPYEAAIIQDALSFYNRFDEKLFNKPKIVFLDVPEDWSMDKMLKRGRIDDKTKEQMELRSKWFESEVVGAIDFFRNNPKFDFIQIQGDKSIEEVHAEIAKHFV
ncbi:MAG: nucleoside monophosphate kinase [Patescibacteria group bacterium]